MFMTKREEEDKLTVKLTLFKENLQPSKKQQQQQRALKSSALGQQESTASSAAVAADSSGGGGGGGEALVREPTISIVPVQYSVNVPNRSQLLNKESSVNSTKILLRRHAHVPKRNHNAHEFFKAIYQARMQDILYSLRIVSIRSVDPQDGKTPLMAALHVAGERQRREVFAYLSGHGATFSGRDSVLRRDLIGWACVLGRCEQLQEILQQMNEEPDFQRHDATGSNCLHLAVMSGSYATVETVLDAMHSLGVSVELEDASGLTAYMLARKLGHSRIAQLLVGKGKACAHKRDPVSFRSPREWSAIGRRERLAQRQRLLQLGNWGVMPLTEEEGDSLLSDTPTAPARGETQAEIVMRSLAPRSFERSSQQLLHCALELWSEQHMPAYRQGADIHKMPADADAAAAVAASARRAKLQQGKHKAKKMKAAK